MTKFLLASLLALPPAVASAQVPKQDKLLYGVAYYDEYMPYDRLAQDVKMMQAAGINVGRIGESTWTTMEPRHVKNHPAIIGYQVDNETKAYGTAGPAVRAQFVDYRKRKFPSLDALHKA